ncbi:AI-2E family transporter [bacterium]|nr:AI-2E family transporter [bacterium]
MSPVWSKPAKYTAGVGLALLAVYLVFLSRPVLPLLIVAGLLAMIVRPAVQWMMRRLRMRRGLAVALVYLLLAVLVPLCVLLAVPVIVDAVSYVARLDYGSIARAGAKWLESALTSIRNIRLPGEALDSAVDRAVDSALAGLHPKPGEPSGTPPLSGLIQSLGTVLKTSFGVAAGMAGAVFSRIAMTIFMFLASIYISLSCHTWRGSFLSLLPPAHRPEWDSLLTRIDRLWGAFFRGELILMLVIGVMSGLGLAALGVPGALYLGVTAGLLEIVPNIGPIISLIPAVLVAILQGSNHLAVSPLVLAGMVAVLYVLIQQIENNLIVPHVLGGAVALPPLVIMAGVLVGASTAGILGALLATPVLASGREFLRFVHGKLLEAGAPAPPVAVDGKQQGRPAASGRKKEKRVRTGKRTGRVPRSGRG